ncbi:hypothetical protein niasHT_009448 [Heterodera trifolii]|uniref:Uncharacterized protein n=1 Tax=Heterodera trifolii TaxID=157864 RepID=A0ABD2MG77_9BILA
MSAHFRTTIGLIHPDAVQIVNNQRDFPVPARPQGQPDNVYQRQIQTIIHDLDDEATDARDFLTQLTDIIDRWMSLRTSMTGNERTADNTLYDEFVATTPFPQTVNDLKKYNRSLRDQRRKLEAAIPHANVTNVTHPANTNASIIHLPKTELPNFSGNCVEYQSFWNSFKSCVHDLPLSDSIKFTYLKQCLSGTPLTLISPLPISDQSYNDALDLLTKSYDNPEDVARSLHNSLKNLPRVRGGDGFCPDLRSLLDQIECICVQMKQQNQSYDNTAFHMEIEQRLPRFVLEEIFRAKEEADDWSTDKLKDQLRNILRRREQIDSVQPKFTPARQSPFKSHSPSDQRYTNNQGDAFPTLTFHTHSKCDAPPYTSNRIPSLHVNCYPFPKHYLISNQQPQLYFLEPIIIMKPSQH